MNVSHNLDNLSCVTHNKKSTLLGSDHFSSDVFFAFDYNEEMIILQITVDSFIQFSPCIMDKHSKITIYN